MNNDIISFDMTFPVSTTSAGYAQVYNVVLNSNTGGFTQVGDAPFANQYPPYSGQTTHVTLNYDSYKQAMGTGAVSYLQLFLTTNNGGGAPSEMYLDNFQLSSSAPPPPSFMVGDLEGLGGFDASLTPLFFELLNNGDDAYIADHPDFSANFMATYGVPLDTDDESEVLDNGVANFSGQGGFDSSNIPDWFNLINGDASLESVRRRAN